MPKPSVAIPIRPGGKFAPVTPAVSAKPSKFGPVPGAKVKTTAPVDDQPVSTARTTVRKPKPVQLPIPEETAPEGAFIVDDLSGNEAAPATEEAPFDAAWEEQVINGEALATEEEPLADAPAAEDTPEEVYSNIDIESQSPQEMTTRGGRQPRRVVVAKGTPAVVGSIFAESIAVEVNRLSKLLKLANSSEDMPETLAALFASDNAMRFISLAVEDPKILATAKKFYAESTAGLPAAVATAPKAASPRAPRQGGNLHTVIEFVTAQGSASRQQIIAGTGIASGSFASVVKASGKFVQNLDKTYSVVA